MIQEPTEINKNTCRPPNNVHLIAIYSAHQGSSAFVALLVHVYIPMAQEVLKINFYISFFKFDAFQKKNTQFLNWGIYSLTKW